MERPSSALRQRETSFNPEAAAFNPGFSSPISINDAGKSSPSTVSTPLSTLPIATMFNYSPFHGPESLHSFYRREPLSSAPVRLKDFLSPDVQAFVKKLEEHPEVREIRASHTPESELTQTSEVFAKPIPIVSNAQTRSNYAAVGINELSAGLGLPTARADANDGVSPTTSYKSRVSQAHPGALYGKLIGWALDKPLTAKGLADFLQNQDASAPAAKALAPAPTSPTGTLRNQDMTRSPPQPERKCPLGQTKFTLHPMGVIVPAETTSVPRGPSSFQHQHRRSSAGSASYRQHTRVSSNKRFSTPRRASRAKRIDQGPLPSAADIYPDDAHWTPSAPIKEAQDYVAYQEKPVIQPQVIIGNPFNWPLPAQVCRPESAPTAADIDAADIDVLALMNELPEPSLDTLARLGNSYDLRISTAFDLPCDERALTPAQADGSRYGLRFYGLGYGDQWELPKVGDFGESEPFRVRSRDHDGWGGREWALSSGRDA